MSTPTKISRRKVITAMSITGGAALLCTALNGAANGIGGAVSEAVYGEDGYKPERKGVGLKNCNALETPICVDSIVELREVLQTQATRVLVAGYYTPSDGGGGYYALDSEDQLSSDNGGTVIVATDGGRWKLSTSGIVSVKQFGAVGDGVKNDGVRIQAAVHALGGKRLFFPKGEYITSAITLSHSIELVGEGPDSVIKQAAFSNRFFIQINGVGTQVSLFDLTIDQNKANQSYGQGKFAINCTSIGNGIDHPAILHVERVHVTNSCEGAIRFLGDRTEMNRELLTITSCRFTNGSESKSSPQYNTFTIYIADAATATIDNCHFEHLPTGTGEGIPAITVAGTNVSTVQYSKLTITNNYISGYGRYTIGSGVGVIDMYIWSQNVVVTGNRIENSHVVPIRGKVNADNVFISGNVIHTVTQHIPSSGSGISIVPATVIPVMGRYIITDNIVKDSGFRGIEIAGNADNKPELMQISNNIIDGVDEIGVSISNVNHFAIMNNMISNCMGSGITLSYCEGNGKISDNMIRNSGSTGIGYVGVQKSLSLTVSGNIIDAPTGQGVSIENIGELLLHGNIVKNIVNANGTQRAFRIGGTSAIDRADIKNNSVFGDTASGPITYTGSGVWQKNETGNSWNGMINYGSAAPTSGISARGDIVYNMYPLSGGCIGWVCIAAGAPGVWKAFGSIEA